MSVHKTPQGWRVRWRHAGRLKSRSFSRAEGFTKADADRFDLEMKRRRRLGAADPLASEKPFDSLVEEWWAGHHSKLAPSTRDAVRSYAERRILPRFDGYRVCDVTPAEINKWRIELESEGVGAATQRKLLSTLSSVFAAAQITGAVASNPVAPVPKPPAPRQRLVSPFPPAHVERLRAHFLAGGHPMYATFVSLMAYSGCRPHEALALTWEDVTSGGIIFRPTKHGQADRLTRLLAPLKDDLRDWRRHSSGGKVFDWTKGGYRNWANKGLFRKAVADCDLAISRPYDLRHAFVTLLLTEGCTLRYVAGQLGDRDSTVERNYVHLKHLGAQEVRASDAIYAARRAIMRP